MKKTIILSTIALVAAFSSANAYNNNLNIESGDFLSPDGTSTAVGSGWTVFLGAFDFTGGGSFSDSFADLDDNFVGIYDTESANVFNKAIPSGGSWLNASIGWDSQETDWDTTFSGKDIFAVFVDDTTVQDLGTGINWDSISSYLIVDTGNDWFNATTSGFITTVSGVSETDTVLKSNGPEIVPEPSTAMLILLGLGLQALRRRRA